MGTGEITRRLKRVEGQIRGLQRMVEEGRDCESILTQLMAARAALDRVGLLLASDFVHECAMNPDGTLAGQRVERVLELIFSRFSVPSAGESAVLNENTVLGNPGQRIMEENHHGQAD